MKNYLRASALMVATMIHASAFAHTFGVGLRAADNGGGIEVFYRSWHGCSAPLFEGEIKIEGIEGTSYGPISASATLSSCDSVGGTSTFPTFDATNVGYYCEVDGAGNILNDDGSQNTTASPSLGFDPSSPESAADMGETGLKEASAVGAILCNEDLYNDGSVSDKWQGSRYTGLSAGRYRVSYVPCDADGDGSDCADGTRASADWDPDRKLVLNVDITVSAALAAAANPAPVDTDGDGVPDTQDAYPDDPTRSVLAVPTLPIFGLFVLSGLLGLVGLRRLRK